MKVTKVEHTPWSRGDNKQIDGAEIIGRARLHLEGGGIVHALMVYTGERVLAVFMNRELGTFEAEECHPTNGTTPLELHRIGPCPICGRTDTHLHDFLDGGKT